MQESDVQRDVSVSRPSRAAALCTATWESQALKGEPSEQAGDGFVMPDRGGIRIFTMILVVMCWHL